MLVLDVDATLVTAHSDKEGAASRWMKGYGFHPLAVFADHGPDGPGEPLTVLLRKGNAGFNTAADHITVLRQVLRQLPTDRPGTRPGRRVLIRADAAGCTHEFLEWVVGQQLSYSVGFILPTAFADQLVKISVSAWTAAYDSDGSVCNGAWDAEATGLLDLSSCPKGVRVIVRKERPHPGAQLHLTDVDGHRIRPTPPPAGPAPNCPTWNHSTAAGHGPKTGSVARRTPGHATCPCTTSTRTASGSPSAPWPATCSPRPRCSPWPRPRHGGGNPSGCGCCPSPDA